MTTKTEQKSLLAQIVEHLERLDNLPIDTPVGNVIEDIDNLVRYLSIDDNNPGACKVRMNWAGTQRNQINFHVFIVDTVTNTMEIFHAIITPGFTTYKLDVTFYNSFGSGYPSREQRIKTTETITQALRQLLG